MIRPSGAPSNHKINGMLASQFEHWENAHLLREFLIDAWRVSDVTKPAR